MADIAPAPDELFFIGLYKIGGKQMKNECLYSIKPYRKWGYLVAEKARIGKIMGTRGVKIYM